jgi:hypothetical protein
LKSVAPHFLENSLTALKKGYFWTRTLTEGKGSVQLTGIFWTENQIFGLKMSSFLLSKGEENEAYLSGVPPRDHIHEA